MYLQNFIQFRFVFCNPHRKTHLDSASLHLDGFASQICVQLNPDLCKPKKAYFNKKKGKGITNYWRITTGGTQLKNHQACFPIGLPAQAIELTTNENDIVCDCFGGSGTTLMACEQLNRKCFMMEYDPKYIDVIIDRWEQYTGEKAILLNG